MILIPPTPLFRRILTVALRRTRRGKAPTPPRRPRPARPPNAAARPSVGSSPRRWTSRPSSPTTGSTAASTSGAPRPTRTCWSPRARASSGKRRKRSAAPTGAGPSTRGSTVSSLTVIREKKNYIFLRFVTKTLATF